MKIIPADRLFKPKHSGYRGWIGNNSNYTICDELYRDVLIWYECWGDGPEIEEDMEQCRLLGRTIFNVTSDQCNVPANRSGDHHFYFVTHQNPMSTAWQMQVPYSIRQSLDWWAKGNRPNEGQRKHLASFQGSMNTNHKRRELFQLASDDIFIKDCDGWQAVARGEWNVIQEYSDLMQSSVFTLCPRGIGISSIRVTEALFRGSIPILVDDDSRYFNVAIPGFKWFGDIADLGKQIRVWADNAEVMTALKAQVAEYRENLLLRDFNLGFATGSGITEIIRDEVRTY